MAQLCQEQDSLSQHEPILLKCVVGFGVCVRVCRRNAAQLAKRLRLQVVVQKQDRLITAFTEERSAKEVSLNLKVAYPS